jgi:methyl-accepting chemotaxis protein
LTAFGTQIVNAEVRKLFDDVNTHVAQYTEAYKKAAHDSHEIDKLLNGEMKTLAAAIDQDAGLVRDAAIAEEKQIEKDVDSQIDATERFILILALSGMVLGGLLAWLIGRSISTPTRAIGTVLVELANGNKQVEVPYVDRGDEVGDNARAASRRWRRSRRRRRSTPLPSAGRTCTSLRTNSRPRSVRSSRPCRRPRPSWRRLPVRSPRPRK